MPVLPAVPSTIVPPGWSVPLASASRTIHSAARSLTEAPGLANSHLPQISQPATSLGPFKRTSGVLPMRSRVERTAMGAVMPAELGASVLLGNGDLQPVEAVAH